jgi:hypothetical protein
MMPCCAISSKKDAVLHLAYTHKIKLHIFSISQLNFSFETAV